MTISTFELIIFICLILAFSSFCLFFFRRFSNTSKQGPIDETLESLSKTQAELTGHLSALSKSQQQIHQTVHEKLLSQERFLSKTLEERFGEVSRKVNETLEKSAHQSNSTMTDIQKRLAVIDTAQKNITDLSSQMVGLQQILSNKQARGAFGEIQLQDLVKNVLPASAYSFQAHIGDAKRVDCLLVLPNPPGSIAIDAKFPLESYRALESATDDRARLEATRAFKTHILKHIQDIASKYIIPGETADSALMFLPSEAVYAELYSNHLDIVEKSYQHKVWIVSPTTLMATLTTVRALLRDVEMRKHAGLIQKEVGKMAEDLKRLDDRVGKLGKHFRQADDDLRQIQISTEKLTNRGERIQEIDVLEDDIPSVDAQTQDVTPCLETQVS